MAQRSRQADSVKPIPERRLVVEWIYFMGFVVSGRSLPMQSLPRECLIDSFIFMTDCLDNTCLASVMVEGTLRFAFM